MGFTDNLNTVKNPSKLYLRWKGKAEKVREDGKEKIEGGKLVYWDSEKQEEIEVSLPLVVCPLEITYTYTGYIPDKGRIWSNEILDFNTSVITIHRTGDNDEILMRGTYNEIKDKAFSNGAKLQTNVYCYCKALGGIVRLNLVGSSKSAWKEFTKKSGRGKIFECPVQISVGEPEESPLGQYIPPKYDIGKTYDTDVIKALSEQDKTVIEYLKYIADKTPQNEVSQIEPQDDYADNVSEAIPGAEDASGEITLEDIPF